MNSYIETLKKYAVFTGRAGRREFWLFVLFNIIISAILAVIDSFTGTANKETGVGLLGGIYSLAVLLPGIGVSIRRLHDTDRSGWWLLLAFIPVIGGLILLVFMILQGTPGPNRFGPNPTAPAT